MTTMLRNFYERMNAQPHTQLLFNRPTFQHHLVLKVKLVHKNKPLGTAEALLIHLYYL